MILRIQYSRRGVFICGLIRSDFTQVRQCLPCWSYFEKQDEAYKKNVINLPKEKCVSIEMLSTFGWGKWAKYHMGIDEFGASGPAKDVFKKFDFTSDRLVKLCEDILG